MHSGSVLDEGNEEHPLTSSKSPVQFGRSWFTYLTTDPTPRTSSRVATLCQRAAVLGVALPSRDVTTYQLDG